jgi:hypothetical protein
MLIGSRVRQFAWEKIAVLQFPKAGIQLREEKDIVSVR